MRKFLDSLTYANITATLALFVGLGGASYAAITLPADSVGKQQIQPGAVGMGALSLPLGTAGITDDKVEDLTKNGCNGGGFHGNATADCVPLNPRSIRSPGSFRSVHIDFRSAGHLLVSAIASLHNEGAPETIAAITLTLDVDRHPVSESATTIAGGQVLQVPIQTLASVSAGSHTAGLEVSAEYRSSTPGDVLVTRTSVIASALPAG